MPVYCEVALPVPLDRVFTYAVREGQAPKRGARVIVPFNNEKLIGVVTALNVKAPADFEARYLEAVLDQEANLGAGEGTLLSDNLLSLGEWMAQYYLAPLGEVLRGMLPLMAEVRRTLYYRITDLGRDVLAGSMDGDSVRPGGRGLSTRSGAKRRGKLPAEELDMERRVLERLAAGEPVKVSTLRTATAATLPVLAALVRKKWIARETTAVERDARRTERIAVLIPEARLPVLTEKQQAILAELAACGNELPLAELRRRDLPSSTLQTLVRRGLVRIEERPAAFHLGGLQPATAPHRLNEPQVEALAYDCRRAGSFPSVFAAWRDRVGQDGGLPGGHAEGAGPGPGVDSAGAGDWLDAADGRAAGRGVWGAGGAAALRANAGRTQRAVAADPAGRCSDCGGHPVGDLCAGAEPGADSGRRGTRPELQAGGDATLQRPRCGGDAGQAGRRGGGDGLGHAVAGELAEFGHRQVHADRDAGSGDEPSAARGGTDRHAARVPGDGAGAIVFKGADW